MPSAYNDNFTSSFPIWITFIYFACLTVMARTSNTMLNKSDKSGYPCLIPKFSKKAFSFSPLSIIVGFLYYVLAIGTHGASSLICMMDVTITSEWTGAL